MTLDDLVERLAAAGAMLLLEPQGVFNPALAWSGWPRRPASGFLPVP